VIVFLYDIGVIGPIAPRRGMFLLLGVKLAEMGYGKSQFEHVAPYTTR
jgi:hypothetical protein